MDAVKQAGITNISIITQPLSTKTGTASAIATMSTLLEHEDQLDRELGGERIAAPATGAVLLHLALAGAVVSYYIAGGFFHSNLWGGASNGGAIHVNLVSSAIPLPADQPPNQNVLATETPSQAPAPPTPKATQKIDEDAIPIQGKKAQPKPQTAQRTPPQVTQPKPDNRAQYGEEQSSNMPRGVQARRTPDPLPLRRAISAAVSPGTCSRSTTRCRRSGTSSRWIRGRRGARVFFSISPSIATARRRIFSWSSPAAALRWIAPACAACSA